MQAPLTQAQIDAYVTYVQGLVDANLGRHGYSWQEKVYADTPGKRYVRIVVNNGSQNSVHTFLDLTNGDILKGSWKAPVANGIRGNLHHEGWERRINHHGAVYLR